IDKGTPAARPGRKARDLMRDRPATERNPFMPPILSLRGLLTRALVCRLRWWVVCGLVLLVFPAGAAASVSPLSATLETGDFGQFNMGAQTAGSGASVSVDTSRSYEGTHSALA